MPKIQNLSWFAFTALVGAIVLAFRQFDRPILQVELHYFLYAGFLFTLRLKMALDDHFYFGVSKLQRVQSKIGFVFAIISWFLLIFSAYNLTLLSDSYILFLLAMGVSTFWILVVACREGFYKEQKYWLFTNVVYIMGAGFLLWASTATPDYAFSWINAFIVFKWTQSIMVGLLYIVVFVDYSYSNSFEHAQND